jgi:arylsulfatase A-like enzyme
MRNAPLRGGKWTLYEGGIRVPFMVAGPGIKPGQTDVPAIGWDFLPTITQLAGGDPTTLKDLDGGSLVPVLHGRSNAAVERKTDALYFHRFHKGYGHSAVIQGDFKLIHFWKTGKTELYDLSRDPGELKDLSMLDPARVKSMDKMLSDYVQRVNPALVR